MMLGRTNISIKVHTMLSPKVRRGLAVLCTTALFRVIEQPSIASLHLGFAHFEAQTGQSQNQEIRNPQDGADLVIIPAGEFWMGDEDISDNPRRRVFLSSYVIYKHLVTVKQYREYCRRTKRNMPDAPFYDYEWKNDYHPICNLTWQEAMAYAKWARGSLPTEAQWEKAARGTEGFKFPWGNTFDATKVWSSNPKQRDGTTSVGKYGISPYGLSDMAGNVWQWCLDWYDHESWRRENIPSKDLVYKKRESEAWGHTLRGGAWFYKEPLNFRTADRYAVPDWAYFFNGFRVVLKKIPKQNMPQSSVSKTEITVCPNKVLVFEQPSER